MGRPARQLRGETDLPEGWSLRPYRDEDAEGVAALLRDAFGSWPGVDITVDAVEHLRWKLLSHEKARRYSLVAELDGRLVGSLLCIVKRFKMGDRVVLGRHGSDMVVHPAYRQRGILAALWARREEDRDAFDVSLGQAGHPASRKLGAQLGRIEFGNATDILCSQLDHSAAETAGGEPTEWWIAGATGFDERIDAFWEEAAKPFEFIGVRDLEYLTWRYDARAGDFDIRLAEEGERIAGYAVLRMSKGIGYIADVLALPGRLDVVAGLVRDALGRLREAGAVEARCAVPRRHPYRDILREHGFLTEKRTIPLNYRPNAMPARELAFLGNPTAALHTAFGDTELV